MSGHLSKCFYFYRHELILEQSTNVNFIVIIPRNKESVESHNKYVLYISKYSYIAEQNVLKFELF